MEKREPNILQNEIKLYLKKLEENNEIILGGPIKEISGVLEIYKNSIEFIKKHEWKKKILARKGGEEEEKINKKLRFLLKEIRDLKEETKNAKESYQKQIQSANDKFKRKFKDNLLQVQKVILENNGVCSCDLKDEEVLNLAKANKGIATNGMIRLPCQKCNKLVSNERLGSWAIKQKKDFLKELNISCKKLYSEYPCEYCHQKEEEKSELDCNCYICVNCVLSNAAYKLNKVSKNKKKTPDEIDFCCPKCKAAISKKTFYEQFAKKDKFENIMRVITLTQDPSI